MKKSLAGIINSIITLHIVLEADPMTEATWLQTLLHTPTGILEFSLIKSGAPKLDTLYVSELFTPWHLLDHEGVSPDSDWLLLFFIMNEEILMLECPLLVVSKI